MDQEDPKALNCRVRIDKKVHPSLYQDLEILGRKDRCERLRSLAQQGLLAEALGVDVIAASAKGGSAKGGRAKRKVDHRRKVSETSSNPPPPNEDAPESGLKDTAKGEQDGGRTSAVQPSRTEHAAVPDAQDVSEQDQEEGGSSGLRDRSKRLMGRAGMLPPDDEGR